MWLSSPSSRDLRSLISLRERKINLEDLIPLIEEKLKEGNEVLFSPSGTSMLPSLKAGRDTVVLTTPKSRLKKYDIALYRRENGQYVLHRVIGVGDSYTFIGDAQLECERNIKEEQIIALCTAYLRGGVRVELSSFRCRAFARLWHYTLPFRRAFRFAKLKIKKLLKKG